MTEPSVTTTATSVTVDTETVVADPRDGLYTYLTAMVALRNDMNTHWPNHSSPVSLEKLTLYSGRWMDRPAVARPDDIRKGPNKYCFATARRLALRWKKRFRYVEGFALSDIGFPCHHAWVIETATGVVVETTWEKPGHIYCGVVVEPIELREHPAGSSVLTTRVMLLDRDIRERRQVWG